MNKTILLLSFFVINMITAQKNVENAFYSLPVPSNTEVKLFKNTHEELANIDSYQFLVDAKPKYILYMMSNKLETSATVGLDNYKDFMVDIGDVEINNAEMFDSFIKVYFSYADKNAVKGTIYIGIRNNLLSRFLLMFPNESASKSFDSEVNVMLGHTIYKSNVWAK